jgi:hypothetical protein
MTFPEAVKVCKLLRDHLKVGLAALEGDRGRVTINDTSLISGSVNVEKAAQAAQEPAWDYGIGITAAKNDVVIWVEVHPANSRHVRPVLNKLDWLIAFLRNHASHLNAMPKRFIWLATKGVYLPPNSRERKMLSNRGLRLESKRLDLGSVL